MGQYEAYGTVDSLESLLGQSSNVHSRVCYRTYS
jgi:hypothetical protein